MYCTSSTIDIKTESEMARFFLLMYVLFFCINQNINDLKTKFRFNSIVFFRNITIQIIL